MPSLDASELRPRVIWPPISAVDNKALTEDDMMLFITAAVNHEGLVGHNINAFNEFIDEGLPHILTELFHVKKTLKDTREQTEQDRQRESVTVDVRFNDVNVGRPECHLYPIGQNSQLLPNETRLSGRSYAAALTVGMTITLTAVSTGGREEVKRADIPPFQVANIPIMVGSNRCHTWNLTREARKALQEDPNEPGGYFLAKGVEWVIELLENISFNKLHTHVRMTGNERVRGEFISQPGGAFENSTQVIVRHMVSGEITIEINSTKFSKVKIPFFLIFRILGMTSDREILEQIVFDPDNDSPVVRHMTDIVERGLKFKNPGYAAVQNELNREKLTEFIAALLSKFVTNRGYKKDEDAIKYLNTNLLGILDRALLPHMGSCPASRRPKLRFLAMLIHKILLVEMGILEPTDRDSFSNKRCHGGAVSYAKAFKTQFNNSALTPLMKVLRRDISSTPFEELEIPNIIEAAKNAMASSDLSRTMDQSITSGNKTIVIRRRAIANRVSTQALERKNTANVYSTLRSVSAANASSASKQTERADKMRRVHASYTGYICVAKSADTGEMVGMKKELAITATVCSAGEPYPLISYLLIDPSIEPIDKVSTPDILRKNLACVFVNGQWIGCCRSAPELVERYRALRRESRIVDPQTTIAWNPVTDNVDFLLDSGRLTRPLLIVDNNLSDYDAACRAAAAARRAARADWSSLRIPFRQNIRLDPSHIAKMRAGRMSLEDLRAEGIAEWITPEEAENCLIAPSLAALRAAAEDVTMRYTHCDIEQAIFGLTALLSPFGNHTQPARITYETGQGRQAGGWYSFAAPYRVDKNRFFQYYCEVPLVRTISYNWLYPNGMNTNVAYMLSDGYNQEDSAVFKNSFVQRGGFAGAFYRFEKAELDKGEVFRTPDMTTTKNLKPNASYEKLVDGFVRPGTVVQKGDVIIGRVAPAQAGGRRGAGTDGYLFIDRSIVYHLAEPAIVVEVYTPRGPNDMTFGLVKLRYYRPLCVGDKMCLTPDHDVLTERGWVPIAEVATDDKVATLNARGALKYEAPTEIFAYDFDGDLLRVQSVSESHGRLIDQLVTPNHKLLAARADQPFALHEAQDLVGVKFACARASISWAPPTPPPALLCRSPSLERRGEVRMWAAIVALALACGVSIENDDFLFVDPPPGALNTALRAGWRMSENRGRHFCARRSRLIEPGWFEKRRTPHALDKNGAGLPAAVWRLARSEAREAAEIIFDALRVTANELATPNAALAGDLQRLALHAGRSIDVGFDGAWYVCRLPPHWCDEPLVAADGVTPQAYRGKVHCLTVPTHVFYVRRNGLPSWTGNSSRAGNKSITALLAADSDLPYDEDGITPDVIINPHSIPSRMTLGQVIETFLCILCEELGVIADGTAFRTVSIGEIAHKLVAFGFRFSGLTRLYNGRTGEYYDAAIFVGMMDLQRLQKFVKDDGYGVGAHGPTDALTGQPLEGKNARGGLRLGAMEAWVLESQGAMMALIEKLFLDSDGCQEFLCRTCGLPAIYNAHQSIYRCNTCGEAADIGTVDSSRSSIVFQHEVRATNTKVIRGTRPREFEE